MSPPPGSRLNIPLPHDTTPSELRYATLRRRPMGTDTTVVRSVLAELGSPQDAQPTVLVAGTNGKGSVASMLDAMVRAAGYRAGFFHSPALGDDAEQIHLDGHPLDRRAFDDAIAHAETAGERVAPGRLTWFEATTVAAYSSFAQAEVDIALVEVGMGGADDCTNVPQTVLASTLVSVGLEHRRHLGSTLAEIARNKAGVFRPGRPAVLGWLPAEAEEAARAEGRRLGALVEKVDDHCRELRSEPRGRRGQYLTCRTTHHDLAVELPLLGTHQARNAVIAIRLAEHLWGAGFDRLDTSALARGLASSRWPGRLEWLDGLARPVLLDVAHNPPAIRQLVAYLESAGVGPVDLLFGTFDDKDAHAMLEALEPHLDLVVLTRPSHHRAAEPTAVLGAWSSATRHSVTTKPSLPEALDASMIPTSKPLLVTGSMHLVGEARARLVS